MSQIVEYVLTLKDNVSRELGGVNLRAEELEGTLGGVNKMLGAIGLSMVAFAGFEALKDAHEVWEKMEFSISQVEAGLKSTKGAAGLTFDEIQTSAEKTAHSVKFAQSEILGMQSILLTFPSITKDSFQPATDIIADMSTRLGQDLKSSAIQVGKALQDPIKGVTALRRVGVNFNETQTATIKHLAETNHLAQAQALIMKELNLEFAGSAQAAAAADAGFEYSKSLEEIQVEVGHLVDKLQEELMPVALKFLEWVKEGVEWIKKNTSVLWALVKGLGATWLAFKTATMFIIPLVEGLTAVAPAAEAAAVGMETVGAAATLSLGPWGLLAAAIGTVISAYSLLSSAEEKRAEAEQKRLVDASADANKFLDDQTAVYEKTMKHDAAVVAAKKYYIDELTKQHDRLEEEINKTDGKGEDYSVLQSTINSVNKSIEAAEGYTGLIPNKALNNGANKVEKPPKQPATIATGSKNVTINVSIAKLGETHINTTNIKEGVGKMKDAVLVALTSAVNDFQIVAGQ